MCLGTVTKVYTPHRRQKRAGKGWKVMTTQMEYDVMTHKRAEVMAFPYINHRERGREIRYPSKGVWLRSERKQKASTMTVAYIPYFHLLASKEDARKYMKAMGFTGKSIVPVLYRHLAAEGMQLSVKVLVAKEIMFI